MVHRLHVALFIAGTCLACAEPAPVMNHAHAQWPAELTLIVQRAQAQFDVPTVSVEAFETLPEGVVLLDVRTAAEASVSGIPGARLLASDAERQAFLDAPTSDHVVVSCAAGWRSAEYTQALRAVGVKAYSLEGGLFAWAAAGRKIVDPAGQATKRVHAYNEEWAKCLSSDHVIVLEPTP